MEAKVGEEHLLTPELRKDLLGLTGQRQTQALPSILPLFLGMRLLLHSKDCVRFGLMKGCECVLEQIIFDDQEILPVRALAGARAKTVTVPWCRRGSGEWCGDARRAIFPRRTYA